MLPALGLAGAVCALVVADVLLHAADKDPLAGRRARAHGMVFLITEIPRWLTLPLRVGLFVVAARHALIDLSGVPGPVVALAAFIAVDLFLYAWHRLLHESRLGRAFHDVHHSSPAYDLSVGARVSPLQRLVDDAIYVPIALAGVPAETLILAIAVNRTFQFWPHTRAIPALRWLDPWLNTPANHRVHHRSATSEGVRNYGSALMIWDRLFGTYEPERADDARSFGGGGFRDSTNPLVISVAPLVCWWRETRSVAKPSANPDR